MSSACVIAVTSTYSLDDGLGSTLNCTVEAVDGGSHVAIATLIITVGMWGNIYFSVSVSVSGTIIRPRTHGSSFVVFPSSCADVKHVDIVCVYL